MEVHCLFQKLLRQHLTGCLHSDLLSGHSTVSGRLDNEQLYSKKHILVIDKPLCKFQKIDILYTLLLILNFTSLDGLIIAYLLSSSVNLKERSIFHKEWITPKYTVAHCNDCNVSK